MANSNKHVFNLAVEFDPAMTKTEALAAIKEDLIGRSMVVERPSDDGSTNTQDIRVVNVYTIPWI